jgi:hypothetical protein
MILEKVYDELYGMIEDLQKKVGKGGGSTVTITPTLQSGEKLADYSIDGTAGAIYAPPVLDYYSNVEHVVGEWIDGREVFEKTIIADTSSTSGATIAELTDADMVVDLRSYGYIESTKQVLPLPYYTSSTDRAMVYSVGNEVKSNATATFVSDYAKYIITVRYVKSSTRTKTTKKK